jgi:hypothetical protein
MSDVELPAEVLETEVSEVSADDSLPPSVSGDYVPDLEVLEDSDLTDVSLPAVSDAEFDDVMDLESPKPCSRAPSPVPIDSESTKRWKVPSPQAVASWLQTPATRTGKLVMELYSPPRVGQLLTTLATLTTIGCLSFDILVGWDFDEEELRFLTVRLAMSRAIDFIYCSPPCTMFSELTRLWNAKRMSAEIFQRRWAQAEVFVNHCMELCQLQHEKNRKFMYEHPRRASSWKLASVMSVAQLPGVSIVHFDMCAVGMKSPLGAPVRKRTSILTNSDSVVAALQKCQCPKNHIHRKIEGSELGHKMSKWCQVYPEPLVKILAEAA